MKKLMATFLATVMILGVFGCTKDTMNESAVEQAQEEKTTENEITMARKHWKSYSYDMPSEWREDEKKEKKLRYYYADDKNFFLLTHTEYAEYFNNPITEELFDSAMQGMNGGSVTFIGEVKKEKVTTDYGVEGYRGEVEVDVSGNVRKMTLFGFTNEGYMHFISYLGYTEDDPYISIYDDVIRSVKLDEIDAETIVAEQTKIAEQLQGTWILQGGGGRVVFAGDAVSIEGVTGTFTVNAKSKNVELHLNSIDGTVKASMPYGYVDGKLVVYNDNGDAFAKQ